VMAESRESSRAFLVWLSRQAHQPDPLEFLATTDGVGMMPGDLEHLVVQLHGLGLVSCDGWRAEGRLPCRVSLRSPGWHCLEAFGADVTAWAAAR